ncbi:MAG: hypothetical protein IJ804_08445 [Prevotella sp.]|nr:hypothetical protein [Prevotella sp.]
MVSISDLKKKAQSIPEFSEKNYNLAGYIVAALITASGLFLIYEVLSTDALTFKANWNMFKSPLGNLCFFIGFIWAMLWWGKFTHWSSTPVVETRDRFSGKLIKREENYDIMEQGFAKIIMPLLGHFVIEPIIYAAIIYYPIQCIIALVGAIFPYILTLIVLAIIAGAWLFTREVNIRYHSVLLVLCGIVFTLAFGLGGYAIMNSEPGSTIQMLADTEGLQSGYDETATDEAQPADEQPADNEVAAEDATEEEEDDQFEGVGEEGLLGSLPNGTTTYTGDMQGFPIEFTITKSDNSGDVSATYKNVKYGTTMQLSGESLPAMGGDIDFYGKDGNADWVFHLSGDADNISGTAQSGDKEMNITLRKK